MNVLAGIRPGWRPGRGILAGSGWRAACLLAFGCAVTVSRGAVLQDAFTNRETITAVSGQINADNSAATVEPVEPKHGGKTGGRSLWISWIAPTNGVATFKTEGSGFDTLLAAYYFGSTNDTTFDKLLVAAGVDDAEGLERESEIDFGVVAGQRYEIAVDGYYGATGAVDFKWSFESTPFVPPIILNSTADEAVKLGDPVTLSVLLTNAGSAQFKWFFNGVELGNATTNLVIASLQVTNVGRYKLRIDVGGVRYFTPPTEIQVNSEGVANVLARGKLLDAPGSGLIGGGGGSSLLGRLPKLGGVVAQGAGVGVVRGYNGSQIFNTTYATVDTNEPAHCGINGGASYWLMYQPPTNGTITLDTVGSGYDTVMEAYTWNGALTGFPDLISLACDNDGAGTNGASRLQFSVVKSRQYVVVVEGVNNARGTAWLNYTLNTNQLPVAPTLLTQPATVTVAQGSPATILANVAGSPPLRFSWRKNTTPLPGVTAPGIYFPSAATNDTASYVVTVTNDLGTLTATLPLRVLIPPQCALVRAPDWLQLSFPTVSGQKYTVEEAGAVAGPWQPWPNFYLGNDQPLVLYLAGGGTKFFRVRVE